MEHYTCNHSRFWQLFLCSFYFLWKYNFSPPTGNLFNCPDPSDPWFNHSHYYNSITCAPLRFIFTCTWQNNLWGTHCLNLFQLGRYCTISLLVMPISETQHWTSTLNLHHRLQQELPGGVSDNEGMRFLSILLPW